MSARWRCPTNKIEARLKAVPLERRVSHGRKVRMDNATKEKIVDRLHEMVGVCPTCGRHKCGHGSSTELPESVNTDDVLRAINLDEYFFKEEVANVQGNRLAEGESSGTK